MRILEIGCGEGGVLKAFINRGCTGVGVELDPARVEMAKEYLPEDIASGKFILLAKDIYESDVERDFNGAFDVIILKDVIEHIHNQPRLIRWMKTFLKPSGTIFFGFPPWYMPFGGHQQICKSFVSKLPYIHLLPRFMYRGILKSKGENVEEMMEIRDTGISIERFEKICKQEGYAILHKKHYLLNPIYEWKFGWKPIKQAGIVSAIPFVRNFFTTCVYYCIILATEVKK